MPRVLVVRADGKVFTGGVDVQEFAGLSHEQGATLFEDLVKIVHKLEAMPIPTVASVHALCLTAGFELSLGCDILLAGEAAKFGLVERVVGLTPGMGGTQGGPEGAGPPGPRGPVGTAERLAGAPWERGAAATRAFPSSQWLGRTVRFGRRRARG